MVFVLLLLLAQTPSQAPPRDTKPRPSARTATVAGRVLDAETGLPIVGARIHIGHIRAGGVPVSVDSGGDGRFEARGLVEGGYRISVSPPPLQATHLSKIVAGDGSTLAPGVPALELKPGEVRDNLVIRLERAGAVDGRVIGDNGEGLANLAVIAERPDGLPIRAGREIRSDDRGMFRVFALPAGPLRVCAVPGGGNEVLGTVAAGERARSRYVKTCVPSDPESPPLELRSGADPPVVTIQMQRAGTFAISGTVSSESGSTDIHVSVSRREMWASGGFAGTAIVRNGTFTIQGLSPGEYTVMGSSRYEPTGLNQSSSTEAGGVVVRVVDSDITGVELRSTRGATVRGRLVADAPLPRGVALQVAPVDPAELVPTRAIALPRPAAVRADRTFEIAGLRDPVLWEVLGLPEDWSVTAVRYRGKDVTHYAVRYESTSDPEELEIVVSPGASRLFIHPLGVNAGVALQTFVFSAGRDRLVVWSMGQQKVLADGTLAAPGLREGEYLVAILTVPDAAMLVRRPGGVSALKRVAARVVLAAGERRTIELAVTSMSDLR